MAPRRCLPTAEHPADKRTLGEWGRAVAVSERTLARAWLADTGVPFGRWRTLMRLQAALPALAASDPVSLVARRVGYDTTSAFVAAFRRETGFTPAAYFHDPATSGVTGRFGDDGEGAGTDESEHDSTP